MGEPAGIGGELTLMAWRRRADGLPAFVAFDDPDRLAALSKSTGLDVPIVEVGAIREAAGQFSRALPVSRVRLPAAAELGAPSTATAAAVVASIEAAVGAVLAGDAAAVVTNPIQKKPLYEAGFAHPGHTEFLGALAGPGIRPVMMLAVEGLRVVPVTVHIPLAEVARSLDRGSIVEAGRVTAHALARDFGLAHPRLAVAALNPHAGEGGTLGREEIDIIAPAVEELRAAGIAAEGPLPADTLFHDGARRRYDAILCMYHDQALIPLKTIDFAGGVNITLGLPFVRTSPDHGTALDIAGTGTADPTSFIAALKLAAAMAATRAARHAA
jgi:4-hydroxythreonine-4-phosphate dehydrogenase